MPTAKIRSVPRFPDHAAPQTESHDALVQDNHSVRIIGAIPAAGHGTRLQPLPGSKELVPIRGKPVIDYLAERMLRGGATELRIVTRPDKTDLREHAARLGASVVLGRPATVGASIASATHGLEDDDIVLVGFPDTIWQPEDGYRILVESLAAGAEAALGLFRVPDADLSRSDVVVVDGSGVVERIHVKPTTPPANVVWGCAAVRARSLDGLAASAWPGQHFDAMCRDGSVTGILLSNVWLDIGTLDSLARARDHVAVRGARA